MASPLTQLSTKVACWMTTVMFSSQGTYATRALRDIGPFLRYMESEFNIKVSNKVADEFLLVLSESKGM